ncbi:MAG: T9SS type A sorting domain-containing protein [candidate division WOR-3 bacterium]|nr:T9SS type A sorting domain-containing protein [candidate division WOR-3 bacterium]
MKRLLAILGVSLFCLAFADTNMPGRTVKGHEPLKGMDKPSVTELQSPSFINRGGGPDDFGYQWLDSRDPGGPVFRWIEISSTGYNLNLDDDDYYYPIPFQFTFYDSTYNNIAVGSNGTVYFHDMYLGLSNYPIPSTNIYDVHIFTAPYWDDLNPAASGAGGVFYQIFGDTLVVEWYNVPIYGTNDFLTFEAVLIRSTGEIIFQYLDSRNDAGNSATVGIQGRPTQSPLWGLQFSYNTPSLIDSLAIRFFKPTYNRDVGMRTVLAPGSRIGPGATINPQTRVKNFGRNTESFSVYCRIDSAGVNIYNQNVSVASLPPGQETTATFPNWTACNTEGILYNLTFYTVLAGDQNPANDTIRSTTTVTLVGNWVRCADLPNAELSNATGYDPVNDDIYSFGGTPDGGYTYHNYTFRYDPTSNSWQIMANMPYAGDWIDASYVRGKFYIFGLYDGTVRNYNMIYDVANDSWTTAASLPQPRIAGGQVVYKDSLIYMLGGFSGSAPTNNVQIYNTYTNTWTTGTSLPANFMMGGVAITRDTIWVIGGYNGSAAYSNLYYGVINPTNCENITWYTGAALPIPNMNNGATQIYRGGRRYLYMVGGFENLTTPSARAWEYNIDNNTWTALPDYPFTIVRNDFLIARQGYNEIYVCGGDDGGDWTATAQVWKLPWLTPGVSERPNGSENRSRFGFASHLPNPTKSPVIIYTITKDTDITLKVFDATGRLITTLVKGKETAGTKQVTWNTDKLENGIYFLRLEAEGKVTTHKLILVK